MAIMPTEDPKFAVTGGDNVRPPNNDLVQNGVPAGGTWGRQNLNWMFMAISKWIDWIRSFAMDKSLNLSDLTNKPQARTNLGLGDAATRNIGTGSGNVMQVGAGGWLGRATDNSYISGFPATTQDSITNVYRRDSADYGVTSYAASIHIATENTWGRLRVSHLLPQAWLQGGYINGTPWTAEIHHTGNILATLGQSTAFPMTQKAVTDALNTKANTSTQVLSGTGLSGGGNLSSDRTLSVNYGTTAGTAAQGNDSRIVNSVQTSGDQTIVGVKTFSSFPVTPSAAPTANYQAANKKYVDDSAIGVGQTMQSFILGSERVIDNPYTNNTGKPIAVFITVEVYNTAGYKLLVDGYQVGAAYTDNPGATDHKQLTAIVPSGKTYQLTQNWTSGYAAVISWVELR